MTPRIRGLVMSALALGLLAGCSRFQAAQDDSVQNDDETAYGEYTEPDKLFTCEVPAHWTAVKADMRTRNVEFLLKALRSKGSKEKVMYSFTIFYYPPDSPTFRTPAEFVRANTVEFRDWSKPEVKDAGLKAGPSRRWTRTRPVVDGYETDSYVVLVAHNGFFVLNYTSLQDLHEKHLPDFEHLLQTFQPGPRA
jgi:hypothetical protein